jgi:hypothetical protein
MATPERPLWPEEYEDDGEGDDDDDDDEDDDNEDVDDDDDEVDDYEDDQRAEDDASFTSTPPLPPPFSPDAGPSYEALDRQAAAGSHDKAGQAGAQSTSPAQPLLEDCFPRPPPRDLASSAMIAANSALGATSPIVRMACF